MATMMPPQRPSGRAQRRLQVVARHAAAGEQSPPSPRAAVLNSGGPSGQWPPALPEPPPWPPTGREGKESDVNVNYFEEQLPRYELPPLLVASDGLPIRTAEEWRTKRRPEILSLFANLVYGVVPQPSSTLSVSFSVVATDTGFMGGRATRKDVEITSTTDRGALTQRVLVFSPNSSESPPCPAFLHHSFDDTRGEGFAAHAERPDRLRNGWPLGAVLDRGYGLVVVSQNDVVSHNEVGFGDGTVHSLFYPQGQSFPKANEWGCISAIAWGASRALDYLQTDTEVDATRVAVMGHSKMGKAAVWTAATDERFALCVSAQSGCAGAALWRRKYGETLEKMVTRFPYWLCRNAHKFVGQEDDLPVDQHM
jgi:hypothetical protein